ncbi:MAG TPA: hypothetical protein VKV04_08750 [Verrucomicrobiae bacterium]|nr:hypothetical protein [Verrucomicrobiae bacterium]
MNECVKGGHSAQVRIKLLVNGSSIPVAQMGPDFLLVNGAIDHPPGNARIILQVDESKREWDVHLPEGISSTSKRIVISAVE